MKKENWSSQIGVILSVSFILVIVAACLGVTAYAVKRWERRA